MGMFSWFTGGDDASTSADDGGNFLTNLFKAFGNLVHKDKSPAGNLPTSSTPIPGVTLPVDYNGTTLPSNNSGDPTKDIAANTVKKEPDAPKKNFFSRATSWVSKKATKFKEDITGETAKMNQAVKYFQTQGWTLAQAEGIVANLKAESDFNIHAKGDSGLAFGVAQWHPDRQAEFKSKMKLDIHDASFEQQLAFVNYELREGGRKSAGDKLAKADTAEAAARVVSIYYEGPRDKEGEANKRAWVARDIDSNLTADAKDVAVVSAPLSTPKKPTTPTNAIVKPAPNVAHV